jgi:hypothetical protein
MPRQNLLCGLVQQKNPRFRFDKPDKRKPAWEDYLYWQKTNRKILQRINTLQYVHLGYNSSPLRSMLKNMETRQRYRKRADRYFKI